MKYLTHLLFIIIISACNVKNTNEQISISTPLDVYYLNQSLQEVYDLKSAYHFELDNSTGNEDSLIVHYVLEQNGYEATVRLSFIKEKLKGIEETYKIEDKKIEEQLLFKLNDLQKKEKSNSKTIFKVQEYKVHRTILLTISYEH